jgi:hypothetical protein
MKTDSNEAPEQQQGTFFTLALDNLATKMLVLAPNILTLFATHF